MSSVLAMTDWNPVVIGLGAAIPGLVAAVISWLNRRSLKTHNGRTIGEQVEQANVSSAASLVHTTKLVEETAPPAPPLVDAARAGLEEATAAVPVVIRPPGEPGP